MYDTPGVGSQSFERRNVLHDIHRFKLLFDLYPMPRCRVGRWLTCAVRGLQKRFSSSSDSFRTGPASRILPLHAGPVVPERAPRPVLLFHGTPGLDQEGYLCDNLRAPSFAKDSFIMMPTKDSRPLRVLVADDMPDARDSLHLLLSLWGHDVCEAADGAVALQRAQAFQPDVAILDLAMPHVDGLQVARQVRHLRGLDSICLIAVTGHADEANHKKATAAGFDYVLVKPCHPEELARILGACKAAVLA
jgi:CheY-like chemotaxis protein